MAARKRYRLTVWEKGGVHQAVTGDYWVRHDQLNLTRREANLLQRVVLDLGYKGRWCPNVLRPVNGRMVSVEELTEEEG